MTFKDNLRRKTGEFLTNSQEMFDKIFAQATRELRIRRKPKSASQKPASTTAPEATRTEEKKTKIGSGSEKPVPTYKASEKVKTSSQPKPKVKASPRKASRVFRTSLLFLLLLVLAGFAANHFAIIDFSVIADFLGLAPKPIVQAPVPKKQPVKPAGKSPVPQQPAQSEEKPTAGQPASTAQVPSAASKEEKLVQLETPTTVVPLKEETPRVEDKAVPPPITDQPKPAQPAAQQEAQPVPVQVQVSEKPTAPVATPSKPAGPQYPYAVYLGSFKAPEAVKKAVSDYQEKGFSAYWARVDLGDKGVWYRFFTGHFATKEEVEKYLFDHKIQGASLGNTKYAALIGRYGTDKDVEDQKRALFSAGFCPYVIKHDDGRSYVYSGAFDRKEHAEKERSDLAAKGIKSEVVER